MKRDMNLIRALLLEIEGDAPKPDLSAYSKEQQVYHLALLVEAGLVDGNVIKDRLGYPVSVVALRLTWAGHEFLDAARNETIWKKAIERLKNVGGNVTLSVLEKLLEKLLKEPLGLD